MLMHLANDLFGKQTGLAGNPNQHRRLGITHHFQQRDIVTVNIPVGEVFAFLHQTALEVEQVGQFIGQQPKAIDHKDAATSFLFAETFRFHLRHDLFGNTAACRSGTEEGDGLVA